MREFQPSNGGVGVKLTAAQTFNNRAAVPGKGNGLCFSNSTDTEIRVTWGGSGVAGSASGYPILGGSKETVELTDEAAYVAVWCATGTAELSIHRGFLLDEAT